MIIDFTCHKCDASFEIDAADLIDANERLKCPNCDAKAPQPLVDDFGNALGELCKAIAALRTRFAVGMELETDDLPAPYDVDEDEDEDDEDKEVHDDDDLLNDDHGEEDED